MNISKSIKEFILKTWNIALMLIVIRINFLQQVSAQHFIIWTVLINFNEKSKYSS